MKLSDIRLKTGEALVMNFSTGGWHDFYVVGTEPVEMWKKLIKMFNYYNGTNYNIRTIRSYEYFCDFYVPICKFSIDKCFVSSIESDEIYHNKDAVELGDFIKMYYGKKE